MRKKIYVADDDTDIVYVISLILKMNDFDVESTIDARTIVSDVKNKKPDIILLDVFMSGIDGRDICKTLKSDDSVKHIPVIMISANREIEKMTKEIDADDYIAKPFEISELLLKINNLLNKTN